MATGPTRHLKHLLTDIITQEVVCQPNGGYVWLSTVQFPFGYGMPNGEFETMAFRCSPSGTVLSWQEIGGPWRYHTRQEALAGHALHKGELALNGGEN